MKGLQGVINTGVSKQQAFTCRDRVDVILGFLLFIFIAYCSLQQKQIHFYSLLLESSRSDGF